MEEDFAFFKENKSVIINVGIHAGAVLGAAWLACGFYYLKDNLDSIRSTQNIDEKSIFSKLKWLTGPTFVTLLFGPLQRYGPFKATNTKDVTKK